MRPIRRAVEALERREEAVMGDPQPADHREADRIGEQVGLLAEQGLREVGLTLGDQEPQHQQRDRDREDAVAEGNDPVELDSRLVAVAGLAPGDLVEAASALCGHPHRYGQERENPPEQRAHASCRVAGR